MKLPVPPRRTLIAIILLLLSNILTGFITRSVVRSHDFSDMNIACLLNWGGISIQLSDAATHKTTNYTTDGAAGIYRSYERNARLLVHYPKFAHRIGLDKNRSLLLFCWAVAADDYHNTGVDIPIDPQVWQAFLNDGPKSLPVYWDTRNNLTGAGADNGLIHGYGQNPLMPVTAQKPPPYKMGPLPRPYQPRPDETNPT